MQIWRCGHRQLENCIPISAFWCLLSDVDVQMSAFRFLYWDVCFPMSGPISASRCIQMFAFQCRSSKVAFGWRHSDICFEVSALNGLFSDVHIQVTAFRWRIRWFAFLFSVLRYIYDSSLQRRHSDACFQAPPCRYHLSNAGIPISFSTSAFRYLLPHVGIPISAFTRWHSDICFQTSVFRCLLSEVGP